jgi:hypothetical protein
MRLVSLLNLTIQGVVDRPGFRRHLRAIINGSERGVYGKQAVHG